MLWLDRGQCQIADGAAPLAEVLHPVCDGGVALGRQALELKARVETEGLCNPLGCGMCCTGPAGPMEGT
jgi:hypothetical protein